MEREKNHQEPKKVEVDIKKGSSIWTLDVLMENEKYEIPVYDIRNDKHKPEVAKRIGAYEPFVAHGAGVYGIAVALRAPWKNNHPDISHVFSEAKPGREPHERIPIFTPPKYLMTLYDIGAIHPEMRQYYATREKFEDLWEKGGAHHQILILRKSVPHLHRMLITTKDDWENSGKAKEQWIEKPSISNIWWPDKDYEKLGDLAYLENPYAFIGISSMNEKGQLPAFTIYDVAEQVRITGRLPFKFAIRDSVGERADARGEQVHKLRSSHMQVAPAQPYETPVWKVHRKGSVDIKNWVEAIGSNHGYVELEGIKTASRDHPENFNITPAMFEFITNLRDDYIRRHPPSTLAKILKKGVSKIKGVLRRAA